MKHITLILTLLISGPTWAAPLTEAQICSPEISRLENLSDTKREIETARAKIKRRQQVAQNGLEMAEEFYRQFFTKYDVGSLSDPVILNAAQNVANEVGVGKNVKTCTWGFTRHGAAAFSECDIAIKYKKVFYDGAGHNSPKVFIRDSQVKKDFELEVLNVESSFGGGRKVHDILPLKEMSQRLNLYSEHLKNYFEDLKSLDPLASKVADNSNHCSQYYRDHYYQDHYQSVPAYDVDKAVAEILANVQGLKTGSDTQAPAVASK